MSEIKLHEQEKIFPLAAESGWFQMAGIQATIQDMDFSFCVEHETADKLSVRVSELESGATLFNVPISKLDLFNANTKEKAFVIFAEVAEIVESVLLSSGVEKIKNAIKQKRKEVISMIGERPDVEIWNMESEEA